MKRGIVKYRLLWLIIFVMGHYSFRASACDGAPESFVSWEEFVLSTAFQNGTTVRERADAAQEEWNLRTKFSQIMAREFFQGAPQLESFWQCLETHPKNRDLLQSLSAAFYSTAIQSLSRIRSPIFESTMSFLKAKDGRLFEVSIRPPFHGAPEKGGFHRSSSSIYMNIVKTTPEEWMLIFLHEVIHSLDDQLAHALPIYGNQPFVQKLSRWLALPSIPEESLPLIDEWLMAGLNRGLLAEYRAWMLSFAFYQAARKEGVWQSIPWMDEILSEMHPGEALNEFTFRYLDPKFKSPTEGIFSQAKLKTRLERLRENLRHEPTELSGRLREIWNSRTL